MFSFSSRVILAALAFVAMPLLQVSAADAPANATQAAIDKAVQEYAEKVVAARDAAVAKANTNRAQDLLHDPRTPVLGDPNGDVTLIEFSDYQCPFCKAAEPRIEQLLKDDKRVRVVIKEFPILSPESIVAAKAALASVKQGKYEQYHQAMMTHKGRLETNHIWEIAAAVGLDVNKLKKDMDLPEISDQIIANLTLARALKISVVPGFIVNTRTLAGVTNETETSKIDFPKEVAQARAAKS